MSFRAIVLGLIGAWLIAYATPWNDWGVRNTMLFGSYLPPILIVAVLAFTGLVNPRLGRWRFAPREIVTMLALVLCVGGIASVGVMRHFPAIVIDPALQMAESQHRERWSRPANAEELATAEAARLATATAVVQQFDRDGDARLAGAERDALGFVLADADANADGGLDAHEISTGLLPPLDGLVPAVPSSWVATGDTMDPPATNSLESARLGDAFRLGTSTEGIINAGAIFTVTNPGGTTLRLHYIDGHQALEWLSQGKAIADPNSDPRAAALLSLRAGDSFDLDNGTWHLQHIQPASIAWGNWLSAFLAWSPVLFAMIAGALALAAIVRHQWFANERLPAPIANVLAALITPETSGVNNTSLFRSSAFRIGFGVTAFVLATKILNAFGWIPFQVITELHLWNQMYGVSDVVDQMPNLWDILQPHLYPTVFAMAFLMTTEVSGSLWGSFLLANLVAGFMSVQGIPITGDDLDRSTVGATAALCCLIIWIGRHHYRDAVMAAFGVAKNAEARAAAPWIWVLIGACVALGGFMISGGAAISSSIIVTVITFGTMLAIARVIAETGTPYASFGGQGRIGGIILGIIGPHAAPMALMPLLMVGYVLGQGDRERLLPHVIHSLALHDRTGEPTKHNRLLLTIGISCLGAAFFAFIAMIAVGHFRGALVADNWSTNTWKGMLSTGATIIDSPAIALERSGNTWTAYAIGAVIAIMLGIARMRWSRFPLHPIGLLVIGGWVTKMCWASYFAGWIAKLLVMRYGGQGLYKKLFPAVIGIMVGEATMIVLCMIISLIRAMCGYDSVPLVFLPS